MSTVKNSRLTAILSGVLVGLFVGSATTALLLRNRAGPIGRDFLAVAGFVEGAPQRTVTTTSRDTPASAISAPGPSPVAASMPEPPVPPPSVAVPAAPSVPVQSPPTAEEVRAAVQDLVDQINGTFTNAQRAVAGMQANGVPKEPTVADIIQIGIGAASQGTRMVVQEFELLGVEKASGQPGWTVDYFAKVGFEGGAMGSFMGELGGLYQGEYVQGRMVKHPQGWVLILPPKRYSND
jgi:hypothetical protein